LIFGFIIRKIRYFTNKKKEPDRTLGEEIAAPTAQINQRLQENLDKLKTTMGSSDDLKIHSFQFGKDAVFRGALVFIDGLVDKSILTEAVLRPLTNWRPPLHPVHQEQELLVVLNQQVLCSGNMETVQTLPEVISSCLAGDVVLLVDGCTGGIVIDSKGWDKRNVTEPQSETVVRGPREGFTENLRTNTALIRRKIRSGQLRVDHMTVGRKTQTSVCVMYLSDVADSKVVETVKTRLSALDVDSVLESGYIEEYIEDAPFSPFNTVGYSEKPDVVAARVLEGRIAIVVDGTPFVLTVPMLFIESFQTAEDYYVRPLYASLIRILRFIAYFITVFAPATYIALTAFNPELIPTILLFTIVNAREGTPFPVFLEATILMLAFEILREAGVRLPRPVGQAISVVGALIMGEAAVAAGMVGAPMVIVIAITAVAGFIVPSQNDSIFVMRIIMMILAATIGIYGIVMGLLAMLLYIGSLTSFGAPYFDGFSWSRNLQDSLVRMPLWSMTVRPKDIAHGNTVRHRFFIPPLRPYRQDENDSGGEES
jgi:spore germination protein KA